MERKGRYNCHRTLSFRQPKPDSLDIIFPSSSLFPDKHFSCSVKVDKNLLGVLSDLTKVTRMHGIDPVVLVLMVGVVMFTLGFAGCVGALRENICLLNFFCGTIVLIFFLELAVAVLAFLFQDWVRDRFREFFESNIKSYRDDIDLQNLIDSLQKAFGRQQGGHGMGHLASGLFHFAGLRLSSRPTLSYWDWAGKSSKATHPNMSALLFGT
ncbi:hypothetical protein P7K49_023648 [Saguinus oedipus]|uniref:Tetraspanin-14 n=1 Tax=Saguinus oedipus TaxID=9490 RepID=A0ABQ9UPJ9_SAGOE|nr:hypothetical protein P7K49_023648 [Saguinus oedipus]